MSRYSVVVIGAGPAGAEAAITARSLGLDVLVIDEAADAGGQIFRHSGPEGDSLRARLKQCGADIAFEHRVWTVNAAGADGGFDVAMAGPTSSQVVQASTLIIATGAIERFYPRPGWTLPGVIGLGAATIMMKASGVLPGRRVLVAGPGPLGPLVAHLIHERGGKVVALADPNPKSEWLKSLASMTARADLLVQGAKWLAELAATGTPILNEWSIDSIEGGNHAESVTLIHNGKRRRFEVDAVCFSDGLYPSTEFYRLLGAAIEYDAERGGWIPQLDDYQRTTLPRLYAAGDGAGILGATAASFTGRIAAFSAARDLGKISEASKELAPPERFARRIAHMIRPRPEAMRNVSDDTIVCRCEDVEVGELRRAVAEGAREINALKAATRCGMGPCGGRICSEAVRALMECSGVDPSSIGFWTARPPLRPVPISTLTGAFDYSDIPISEPAPL